VDLTIIVGFYNMRREAARTLYSLGRRHQLGTEGIDYEVIAVDNGSAEPLGEAMVRSMGSGFRYQFHRANTRSPCRALNAAAANASGRYVMVCIDGARMFSPGIVRGCMAATRAYQSPFVFTLNAHIGSKLQYLLVAEGYTTADEDALIASTDWMRDGYELFDISCLGGSARPHSLPSESNTIFLARKAFLEAGGFNEAFSSSGGGLGGLELFERLVQAPSLQPVLLIGEATFHQMHGGTVTNAIGAPRANALAQMRDEYERIVGHALRTRDVPFCRFGQGHARWLRFLERSHLSSQMEGSPTP
jgi:hypothetical protein